VWKLPCFEVLKNEEMSVKICGGQFRYNCDEIKYTMVVDKDGPGSSVGITTDYGLDGPGSNTLRIAVLLLS